MKMINALIIAGLIFMPLGILLNDYHETKVEAARHEEQEKYHRMLFDMKEQYLADIQVLEDQVQASRNYIDNLKKALEEEKQGRRYERLQAEKKLAKAIQCVEEQLQLRQFKITLVRMDSIHRQLVRDRLLHDRQELQLLHARQIKHFQERIAILESAASQQVKLTKGSLRRTNLETLNVDWNRALKLILYVSGMIVVSTLLAAASQRFFPRR